MKNKLKELNLDFVGGQGPLTKEEELAITAFIRARREKQKRLQSGTTKGKTTHHQKQLS